MLVMLLAFFFLPRFSSDNERKLYLELLALQGLMGFHRLIKSTPIEIIGQHIQEVNSVWTNEKLWALVKHECTNVSILMSTSDYVVTEIIESMGSFFWAFWKSTNLASFTVLVKWYNVCTLVFFFFV